MAFCDPQRIVAQLQLEQGMVVADFGAGAGYVATEVARALGGTGTVYLIDIQRSYSQR
jgi:tRNA A58 N-methylase Trm61